MEIRVLKYFITVAMEENMTRAANILNITQPSLSRQLIQLEEELGVKLFFRSKKGMMLTEDGMFLRQRAEEILALYDKTEKDFIERSNTVSGIIALGCTETMAAQVFPSFLKEFSSLYPNICFELFCGNSDGVKERLDKGLLDVGLVFEPINAEKYNSKMLEESIEVVVIMQKNDKLSVNEIITADMLMDKPLIFPSTISQKDILENWFKLSEIKPKVFAQYNTISSGVLLAQSGVGYALCPKPAYRFADPALICCRPIEPKCSTAGAFIWKKDKLFSNATAKMLEYIIDRL